MVQFGAGWTLVSEFMPLKDAVTKALTSLARLSLTKPPSISSKICSYRMVGVAEKMLDKAVGGDQRLSTVVVCIDGTYQMWLLGYRSV